VYDHLWFESQLHIILMATRSACYAHGAGEGFKVGILVLLKQGFQVTYTMHMQVSAIKNSTALHKPSC
jgi:hypothetical protein